MLKKRRANMLGKGENRSQDNGKIDDLILALNQFRQDVGERFKDIERKVESSDKAALYIAQRLFDPTREHLPEMSNNPLRTIRPMADANTAGSILDPKVQRGEISIPQVWLESYYRHMRGLRGGLAEKAKELALEEVRREKTEEPYEQSELGKGM